MENNELLNIEFMIKNKYSEDGLFSVLNVSHLLNCMFRNNLFEYFSKFKLPLELENFHSVFIKLLKM